jgi:hypothetical protein
MNRKAILIVIGISIVVGVTVISGLRMGRQEKIPDAAELEEYVDSILDWETIVAGVPKLANYEVDEYLVVRGRPGGRCSNPPGQSTSLDFFNRSWR